MNSTIRHMAQLGVATFERTFKADVYGFLKEHWQQHVFKAHRPPGLLSEDGINLFFETAAMNSIAKVGRDFATKLSMTDIPFSVLDTTPWWGMRGKSEGKGFEQIRTFPHDKALYRKCILFGGTEQRSRYGYTVYHELFYEFSKGLTKWRPYLFEKSEAICVFSNFCEALVRAEAPDGFPVAKIRYPFLLPDKSKIDPKANVRKRFKIPNDAFVAFFNFSYGSSIERKNPESVVDAFAMSLAKKPNTCLVLKTTAGDRWTADVEKVRRHIQLAGISEKTILIDATLPLKDVLSLTAASDAYISLHRGEGLGLGMLEAMSLGIPVIASAYGGNMDFTNDETAFLVPCDIVPCTPDFVSYSHVREWAKPDVTAAAKHLATIYMDHSAAAAKSKAGFDYVQDYYSLGNFEKDVRRFLAVPV